MRTILSVLACMAVLGATAQETVIMDEPALPQKEPKNEIGFLGETPIGGSNHAYYGPGMVNVSMGNYQGRVGVQFKRWVKPNMGYRASLGYGDYFSNTGRNYLGRSGDTVFQSYYRNRVPVALGSVGVEMQRQFFKRVYLYAAVDLHVGYGTGRNEAVVASELQNNNGIYDQYYYNERVTSTTKSTLFNVGLTPFVGAKFNFRRVSFGTELSGIRMEYMSVTSPTRPMTSGNGDFSMGDFRQRVFINFRF